MLQTYQIVQTPEQILDHHWVPFTWLSEKTYTIIEEEKTATCYDELGVTTLPRTTASLSRVSSLLV